MQSLPTRLDLPISALRFWLRVTMKITFSRKDTSPLQREWLRGLDRGMILLKESSFHQMKPPTNGSNGSKATEYLCQNCSKKVGVNGSVWINCHSFIACLSELSNFTVKPWPIWLSQAVQEFFIMISCMGSLIWKGHLSCAVGGARAWLSFYLGAVLSWADLANWFNQLRTG